MSDRDRFADLTYQWLQNEELTAPDRQFVVEYLLRLLRNQKQEIKSLEDVLEWNFTGDNIVFNTLGLTIPTNLLYIDGLYAVPTLPGDSITTIKAVAVVGNVLYIGGTATRMGGVNGSGLFSYNMVTGEWGNMSGGVTGLSATVNCFAVNGTDLYFGGDYNKVAGVTDLAKSLLTLYDTTNGTFSAVAPSDPGGAFPALTNPPTALAVSSGVLYVGGNIGPVDGLPNTDNIAKLTIATDTWSAMGGDATADVNAIVVDGSNVYAGSTAVVEKFNGTSWSTVANLGGGLVYALGLYENRLYIGGSHSAYLSVYDTSAGTLYNFSGLDNNVRTILIVDGIPYIGGQFTTPGNQFVKVQNGQLVTCGTSPTGGTGVLALAEYGDSVILGGNYTAVDNKTAKGLAFYFLSLADLLDWLPTKPPSNSPYLATAAPTVNDDSSAGFAIGDKWVDQTGDRAYEAVDVSVGAAVWKESTITASDTQVVFADGDHNSSGDASMTWNKTTKVLQIGTATVYLDGTNGNIVIGDITPAEASPIGTGDLFVADDGGSPAIRIISWGNTTPAMRLSTAKGSKASPAYLSNADLVGRIIAAIYDVDTTAWNDIGAIRMVATENHDATSHGSKWEILIVPNGSITQQTAVTIDEDGIDLLTGTGLFINNTPVVDETPSGLASQYLGGDGAYHDLPENANWFLDDTASDIGGYKTATGTIPAGAKTSVGASITGADTLIEEFAATAVETPDLISEQVMHVHVHAAKTAGTKNTIIYAKFYHRTSGGVETLIGTSENSGNLAGSEGDIDLSIPVTTTAFAATDRGVVKFYGTPNGTGTDPTATIYYQGTTYSRVEASAVVSPTSIPITSLDIDGGTDIGAALADADLIIVDDGAGGTNRKSALSRIKTYIQALTDTLYIAISGNVTQANMATLTGSGLTTLHKHTIMFPFGPITFGPWSVDTVTHTFATLASMAMSLFACNVYPGSTNDGSNYWTISVYTLDDNTLIAQFDTISMTDDAWNHGEDNTLSVTSLITSEIGAWVYATKTGSPGSIKIEGPAFLGNLS